MEEKVRSFNNLPRPELTPSGLPNHWVFGVCHVEIYPHGDLVMAVHPQSSFLLQADRAQILSLGTAADKAEATIPCLLDAFITGAVDPQARQPTDPPPFAPWTWSALDSETAEAIQNALRNHGVRPELCQVGICSAEERDDLETARALVFKMLLKAVFPRFPTRLDPGDSTRCHGCGMLAESFFQPLKPCARCQIAFYHSKKCQKWHWKGHMHLCFPPGSVPDFPPYTYYHGRARSDLAALALMRSLNLHPPPLRARLDLPLYRLVLTGQDTPENMLLLFGPQWEGLDMKVDLERTRLECLLNPPPGSSSHARTAVLDDGSLNPSPRPATEAEQKTVDKVREMQALVQQRVGVGKKPSPADMRAILLENFGVDIRLEKFGDPCSTESEIYVLATNTMDLGIPVGGHRA